MRTGAMDHFVAVMLVSTCQPSPDGFSLDTCDSLCDTNFVLNFMECQDLAPCPVTMITDTSVNSDPTTIVNYEFHFNVSSSAVVPVRVSVFMCDQMVYSSI